MALQPGTPMPKPGEVFPTVLPMPGDESGGKNSSSSSGLTTRALLVGASAGIALCSAVAVLAYRYGITSTQRRASSKMRERDAHLRKVQRLEAGVQGLYTLKSLKSIYSLVMENAAREGVGNRGRRPPQGVASAGALQEEGNARHQELLARIHVLNADTDHASITRRGFTGLLEVLGVNARNASEIFKIWDDQDYGRVDFLALMHYLTILSASATKREKLEFIFEVLDFEHKGLVRVSMVVECVLRHCIACNIAKSRPRVKAHVASLLPSRRRAPEEDEKEKPAAARRVAMYDQQVELADFIEMASLSDAELDSLDSVETRGDDFLVADKFGGAN